MKNPRLYASNHSARGLENLDSRKQGHEQMFPIYDAIDDATTAQELADKLNALDDNYVIHNWHVDRETPTEIRLCGSGVGVGGVCGFGDMVFLVCEKEAPAAPIMQSTVSTLPTFVQVPQYDGIIRNDKIVFEQGTAAFINVNFVSSIQPYTNENYKVPEGYFRIRMNDGIIHDTDQATADLILSLC